MWPVDQANRLQNSSVEIDLYEQQNAAGDKPSEAFLVAFLMGKIVKREMGPGMYQETLFIDVRARPHTMPGPAATTGLVSGSLVSPCKGF